jgi:hypothetical protein
MAEVIAENLDGKVVAALFAHDEKALLFKA